MTVKDLGPVSAYALAVKYGFKGTEEEWATLQADSGANAQAVAADRAAVEALAESVTQKQDAAIEAIETKGRETLESIPEDYTDLSDRVEQLEDKFSYDYETNRYNGVSVEGYIKDDGSIMLYGDWRTTDYIDVRGCTEIISSYADDTGKRYSAQMYFLAMYDEDKNFIGHDNTGVVAFTVPDGVSYIRWAYHSEVYFDLMTEAGTDRTEEYEPYTPITMIVGARYAREDKWKGKKWACVGDSLTEKNLRTTKNYHDYVAEATGIEVVNMGRSGTGYARTQDEGYAFYQRISSVPTDADVVTIFGSGNDLGAGLALGDPADTGTTTLCGCINTTIDNLIALMPTVSLGIVSPTPWVGSAPSNPACGMALYSKALKTICEYRSIPFLDLYHCSNLRPWTEEGRNACYTKDDGNGVHPDETGHALIAPRFRAFLETLLM